MIVRLWIGPPRVIGTPTLKSRNQTWFGIQHTPNVMTQARSVFTRVWEARSCHISRWSLGLTPIEAVEKAKSIQTNALGSILKRGKSTCFRGTNFDTAWSVELKSEGSSNFLYLHAPQSVYHNKNSIIVSIDSMKLPYKVIVTKTNWFCFKGTRCLVSDELVYKKRLKPFMKCIWLERCFKSRK